VAATSGWAWLLLTGCSTAEAVALMGDRTTARRPSSIEVSVPQHFVNFSYDVPKRLSSFAYTIRVTTRLAVDSVFYGQYAYGPGGTGYYSGLQPHPDGTAGVRFSFFGRGATPLGRACTSGADSGSGVTCAPKNISYAPGRAYTFTTSRATDGAGVVYTGKVEDDATGLVSTIGAWRLRSTYPGFEGTVNAFIEKYDGIETCADIPAVKVAYAGVEVNGRLIAFSRDSTHASPVAHRGIYTCSGVSDVTRVVPRRGSYAITSIVAQG
jgi:hypothetical protein